MAFDEGDVDDNSFDEIAAHIASCDSCIRSLSELGSHSYHLEPPRDDTGDIYSTEPDCRRAVDFIAAMPLRASEPIPERIANYRVVSRIGAGGMGIVYKAWHEGLKRPVVVKLLRSFRLSNDDAVRQFEHELRTVGNLKHSAIVQAYDGGTYDGQPFLVMELLEGKTLRDIVTRDGPMGEKQACSIMGDVVSGIRFIHSKSLVHRDVKPTNIMVMSDGSAKLLDFGLALQLSLTDTETKGEVKGSIQYMAPEQGMGLDVDTRADVYSIGATLYYALTGTSPLDCDSALSRPELIEEVKTRRRPPVRSSNSRVSRKLANLIDRSLSLEPDSRPRLKELEMAFRNHERKQLMTWPRTLFLVLILVVGGLYGGWQFRQGTSDTAANSTSYDCIFHDMFRRGIDSKWESADATEGLGVFDASSEAFHIHTVEPTTKNSSVLLAKAKGTDEPEFANGIFSLRAALTR